MSTCAVLLVRDEADIIEFTIRHLFEQVDHVIIADNLSTDGTTEILNGLVAEGFPLDVAIDTEVGYYQDKKTTRLAHLARGQGHQWVVPCDADEWWYATDGRRVADWLAGLARDVMYVEAPMHHHLPTPLDPADEPSPFVRIGYRQREHGGMGKVACRLRPELEIHMGNHSAWAPGPGLTLHGGLSIRHFPWRSEAQYIRKIRNGERAYAATNMLESIGEHWRQWAGKPDEAIADWFWTWGFSANPDADETLIYDPAP